MSDLFGGKIKEDWQKDWDGMPEFSMEDRMPKKQLIVSFKTMDDYKDFAKLVDQKLTVNTKSMWYPKATDHELKGHEYVDKKTTASPKIMAVTNETIPKRFIRIWLGPKPIPALFDKWWGELQEMHPDFELMTIRDGHDIEIPDYLKDVYSDVNTWSSRVDILSLVALYEYGGLYLDTDMMPLKPMDRLFDSTQPFMGQRSGKAFEAAVIGSPKGHYAITELLKELPEYYWARQGRAASVTTGPAFMSTFWFGREDITHYPKETFYPYDGFMAPKREEKEKMFSDKSNFPPEMLAAHFGNRRWGGNPNKQKK